MKRKSNKFFDDAILKKVFFKKENLNNKTKSFQMNPELRTNVLMNQKQRNLNQNLEFRLSKFDHGKALYKDSNLIVKQPSQQEESKTVNKKLLKDMQNKRKVNYQQNLVTNTNNDQKIDLKNKISINRARNSIKLEQTDIKPAKNVLNNKNLKDGEDLTEKNIIKDVRKQSNQPTNLKIFPEINKITNIEKDNKEEIQENNENNLNDRIDQDGSDTSIISTKSTSKIVAIRIPTAVHDLMNDSSELEENIVELVANNLVKKTPPLLTVGAENSADEEFDMNESFLSETSPIEQLKQSPVDKVQNIIDTESIYKKRESLKLAIPIFNSPILFGDKKKLFPPSRYSPEISLNDDIVDANQNDLEDDLQDDLQDDLENELKFEFPDEMNEIKEHELEVDNKNLCDDTELNNFTKEAVQKFNQQARSTPYLFLHGDYEIKSPISIKIRKINLGLV